MAKAKGVLMGELAGESVGEGLFVLPGQGNSLAIDPARVLARARELAAAGETQLALHVIDLIAGGPAGEPLAVEARRLKAELCRTLAQTTSAFVSRSLYKTSANLLDQDATSWTALG